MDFSFIPKLLFSRTSQKDNYRIKEEGSYESLVEVAELTYESYHGTLPTSSDRFFMVIWSIIWFGISLVFVMFGIGIIFWYVGLQNIYKWIKEQSQIETFFVDNKQRILIKETIAFGDIERETWSLDDIRKILISLDIDIQTTRNSNTGQSSTRRIKKYVLAMIINRGTRSEKIGDFDVVEIFETDIEPRLLEICLELGKQFEKHGILVERMVNFVRIEQTDIVCKVCNELNRGNPSYCSSCGTFLDTDPAIFA